MINGEMDVIGFGALNVDLFYEFEEGLLKKYGFTPGSEITSISDTHRDFLRFLDLANPLKEEGGGSAANVVYALAKTGFETGCIGKVGTDPYGDFLKKGLEGVDQAGIVKEKGLSGRCYIISEESGRRTLIVKPGVNDNISSEDIDLNYVNSAKIVHMTSFVGMLPLLAQNMVINDMGKNVKLSFDPGELYAKYRKNFNYNFFKRADYSFPSEEEVEMITEEDYRKGSRKLQKLNPDSVLVCTRGEEGCYILADREIILKAKETKMVDITGAGDVFVAGFLAGVLNGLSPKECGEVGMEAAAESIKEYGREGYPDKEFLDEFLGRTK